MINLPRWVWWMVGVAIVLIVAALLKINFMIGVSGIHMTQGLIK